MIHLEGSLNGEFVRSYTRTRAWSRAEAQIKKAERLGRWIPVADGDEERPPDTTAIKILVDSYVAKLRAKSGRNLLDPTVAKHRTTVQRLADFAIRNSKSRLFPAARGVVRSKPRDCDVACPIADEISVLAVDPSRSRAWGLLPKREAGIPICRIKKLGRVAYSTRDERFELLADACIIA